MQPGPQDPAERPPGETAFTAVTSRRRRGPAVVAIAAIAFLGGAILVKQFGSATPTPPEANGLPSPSSAVEAAVPSSPPTPEPPAPTLEPPSLDPTATPHPTASTVPIAAGTTELGPTSFPSVHLTVTVPAGWERAGLGMVRTPDDGGPIGLSLGAYVIANVNMFPCRWASGQFTDTAYPHTAAGQAQALTAFWGQDPNQTPFFSNSLIAPIATKPSPATLGGYPAWRLQILIPSTFDFSACDGGQLILWETSDGIVRTGLGPGEIDRIWVVDVHGELVVVDAALPLLATKAQETELQAVIDSVAFPR